MSRAKLLLSKLDSDVKFVSMSLAMAKENKAWVPLGYKTFGAMTQAKLKISATEANALIDAEPGQTLQTAQDRIRLAANANGTGDVGTRGPKSNCTNLVQMKGCRERAKANGVSHATQYRLDKLSRDHEHLFEQVKSGELSVNAAAIAAGIVKVKTQVEKAIFELKKCSTQEWNEVIEWMNDFQQ